MYQTIDEKVDVAGVYKAGKFHPRKFQWRKRMFQVEKVHATHDWKDGVVRKRQFSVMAEQDLYLLEFDRDRETWTLAQIWREGS